MTVTFLWWPLTPWPQNVNLYISLTILHLIWNMKAVRWKLLSYCVSPKVLTKFCCDLDLWPFDPKCIGIFLSPPCIYIWNMKVVRWKLLKLLCQNQSVDKVPLWPWPLDPKMYRYLPLAILHLCMKYGRWTLTTTQVIMSEPKCWQSSVVTLNFDLLTPKCICIFLLPSCLYVWNMEGVR